MLTALGVSSFMQTALAKTAGPALQTYIGVREVLTANRTYYFRTDGSDSNSGLADTSGGAFLTFAKVMAVAAALDFNGYTVTIQFGSESTKTWTAACAILPWTGGGTLSIVGNGAANTIISTTSADAISYLAGYATGTINISALKVQTTTSGTGMHFVGANVALGSGLEFGACATHHIYADQGTLLTAASNYTISGGATIHCLVEVTSYVKTANITVTLTGTPAFGADYVLVDFGSVGRMNNMTFSGAATGTRYSATLNGLIYTNGGGANYFPGNSAGSTASGGQYV